MNDMKKTCKAKKLLKTVTSPLVVFFKGLFFLLKNIGKIISFPFRALRYLFETISSLFRFSIGFKFSFYYSAMFIILLFLTSFAIVVGFKAYVELEETKTLQEFSHAAQESILSGGPEEMDRLRVAAKIDNIDAKLQDISGESDFYIEVDPDDSFFDFKEEELPNPKWDFLAIENIEIEDVFPDEAPEYRLSLTKNLERQNGFLAMLLLVLFVFDVLGIIFICASGFRMGKRMMLPIKNMTDSIKHITVNDLDTKLDVRGVKDELKDLALTFNDMTGRIKYAYEKQNQFVSDASHELRTPISVIQGYADMLDRWGKDDPDVLEESVTAIRDESRNMKDLTEKLLYLARSDRDMIRNEKSEFYIDELIEEIARETRLIDKIHEIYCQSEKNMPVWANRKAIKQALRIFIDNSRKFTPEGGKLFLRAYNKKNKIVVEVEDSGIGIPKGDIPLIFNRFYRVDKSRSKKMGGSGLGLSIAKWIVEEHNGKILVKSKEGQGTKMSLVLPYK